MESLPTEILSNIFDYALPLPFLLDPSLTRGPNSAWVHSTRMKKTIIAVCKEWCRSGIMLLYKDVVFRRCAQIPVFLESLRSQPTLSFFVKSITIDCIFPRSLTKLCSESISEIYGLCQNLGSLDAIPSGLFYDKASYLHIAAILPISSRITKLSCPANLIAKFPEPYWDDFKQNLTHLRIGIDYSTTSRLKSHDKACIFPALTSLHIDQLESYTFKSSIGVLVDVFDLPRISHLTIKLDMLYAELDDQTQRAFTRLIAKHGRNIRFLDIKNLKFRDREYLTHCPLLEHLVLGEYGDEMVHPHSHLRHVDIYTERVEIIRNQFKVIDKTKFPQLCRVRCIDPFLLYCLDLPLRIPPMAPTDFSSYHLYYKPGVYIRCEPDYIECVGTWYSIECDDNQCWLPVPERRYLDRDYSDDDNDMGRDEFYNAEDWHVDHATALEMHSSTMQSDNGSEISEYHESELDTSESEWEPYTMPTPEWSESE